MKKLEIISLFLILVIGAYLRLHRLSDVPAGFNYDEAVMGYNAYSISKKGIDTSGQKHPLLYVQSFGEFHLAPFFYAVLISEKIFGVNKSAVRFASVFFGLLTIFFAFLLAQKWYSTPVALLSSLLLAISSWHISTNRLAFETNMASFFFAFGLYFLARSKKRAFFFPVCLFCLFAAAYSYRSYWVFAPIFTLVILFQRRKWLAEQTAVLRRLVFLMVGMFFVLIAAFTINEPRKKSTLFQDPMIQTETLQRQEKCLIKAPKAVCNLLYNRYLTLASVIANHYLVHFSLHLFFAPTGFDPKYAMVNRGLFYLWELPLFLIGVFYLLRRKDPSLKILLPWFLIYPLPHSLTPFGTATRMFLLLPLPQLICGYGAYELFKKYRILAIPFLTIVLVSFLRFYFDYFSFYPKVYAHFTHYGPEEVYCFVKEKERDFDKILISRSSAHPIFFLFFDKYNVEKLIKDRRNYQTFEGIKVLAKMRNIYFLENLPKEAKGNILLIDTPENFDKEVKPLEIFRLPDGREFTYAVRNLSDPGSK